MFSVTVKETSSKRFDEFIEAKINSIKEAMDEVSDECHKTVLSINAPHFNTPDARKGIGNLEAAITESKWHSGAWVEEDGDIIVGIGHLPSLNDLTPSGLRVGYWAFLEYGTQSFNEIGRPYRDAALEDLRPKEHFSSFVNAAGQKDPDKIGIAPNRAWRQARLFSAVYIGKALVERGLKTNTLKLGG